MVVDASQTEIDFYESRQFKQYVILNSFFYLTYSMTGSKSPTLLLRSYCNRIMFKFWHLIEIFLR